MTVNLDVQNLAQLVAENLKVMLPIDERLLSIDQAAERLDCGRTKIHEMIAAGEIPTVGEGKMRRIRLGALIDWMKANEKRAR